VRDRLKSIGGSPTMTAPAFAEQFKREIGVGEGGGVASQLMQSL
jgi:hypothetical protein